jgi:hypothetical protein
MGFGAWNLVLYGEGPKYRATDLNLQHSRGCLTPTAEIGPGRDSCQSLCHVRVFLSQTDLQSERDGNLKESFSSLSFYNKIFGAVNECAC